MCAISVTLFVTFVTLRCAILALISFGTLLAISLTKADGRIVAAEINYKNKKLKT